MTQGFKAASAHRRSADWRADLALVIDGTAERIHARRLDGTPVLHPAAPSAAGEPRWGAALHAANSNQRPVPRSLRPAHVWLWTSLGLQTAAACGALAVLTLVVFPSGMHTTDTTTLARPAAIAVSGVAR
ncbi:hypothetical protein [Aureimonas sp. AU12]|uniref:hypothetical protein n=1 Tax=Aureimonas sp. AU12 TaxID=1638161 RepID=UPI0007851325|nr:hypothetical protein [Aureimonas sp. AU12]